MKNHGLKCGMNKEGFSDTVFNNDKNVLLYDKFLSFEEKCLTILSGTKNDGFMVTCLISTDENIASLEYDGEEASSCVRFYPKLNAYCFGKKNVECGDFLYCILFKEKNKKHLTFSCFEKKLKKVLNINKNCLNRLESDRLALQGKLKVILNINTSVLLDKISENTNKIDIKIDDEKVRKLIEKDLTTKTYELSVFDIAVENQFKQVKTTKQELETLNMLKDGIVKLIQETAYDRNRRFLEANPWFK